MSNEKTKQFFCLQHGAQYDFVYGWGSVFALECGCVYKLTDTKGIVFLNSTNLENAGDLSADIARNEYASSAASTPPLSAKEE